MFFRINYTDDGKKHGECSLFNFLDAPSTKPVSVDENQIPNYSPMAIHNVNQDNNKHIKLEENVTVR